MPAPIVSRPAESRVVEVLLTAVASGPSGLLLEGEAGIGKTTLLLAAGDAARQRGFRVLSARSAAAESVLAYAVLVDLLSEVEATAWAGLPDAQRLALDRVLLRADARGPATDQLEVAASLLAVVERLAKESAVLLAIDDLQWIDTSSKNVVAFVARRLAGRVGVLGASRTDPSSGGAATWLKMPRPDAMARVTVSPLSLGRLQSVVTHRLGRSFPRSTMVRIQETSAGNPLYALELARAIDGETPSTELRLPGSLSDLVRSRIGDLDSAVQEILLAASCLATPTLELVAAATGTAAERVIEVLEPAEASGIIGIKGNRLLFEHPLLAHGVYNNAATARRRAMHRRLSEIVEQPELRARHLALAATGADTRAVEALDAAAEIARVRGAPAAAAEFLDLATELGGDTPERGIRRARYHFIAGDGRRARALLEKSIARLAPGTLRGEAMLLLGVVRLNDDSFLEAVDLLERALEESADNSVSRVHALVMLAFALFNCSRPEAAMQRADDAVASALSVDRPELLSEALGMRVVIRFQLGGGLDEVDMRRALEVNDYPLSLPIFARPALQNALLLAWIGQLDDAAKAMAAIQKRCIEHGEESELIFFAFHSVLLEIWRANFSEAAVIAEDAMERALLLHGDFPRGAALTLRAALAAYAGRQHDARRDANEARAASTPLGSFVLTAWSTTVLGFLEVSLGNYDAALKVLEPLLSTLDTAATEIFFASFVPDAVEALIALNRLEEAEPLIDALEQNGSRLDRPWMLAVGARCRAMLLAARGETAAAERPPKPRWHSTIGCRCHSNERVLRC